MVRVMRVFGRRAGGGQLEEDVHAALLGVRVGIETAAFLAQELDGVVARVVERNSTLGMMMF